jgi:pilus assembly protein CpaB
MSTIAANPSPERTNRWLLIIGVGLALLTGVLVFAALQNTGGGGGGAPSVASGDAPVLIAEQTIDAGTTLEPHMFRLATYAEADLVPEALSDPEAIAGQTTTVEILQGQQLSRVYITSAADDERTDQTAFKLPEGHRGIAVQVDKVTGVAGLLVPGDRVDVVVTIDEQREDSADAQRYMRIQTVLQNVLVVARDQLDVESVVTIDEQGKPIDNTAGNEFESRPEDADPSASLSTVTLALIPDDVQRLILADALGDLTLSMRRFGEAAPAPLQDIVVPVYNR